MDIIIKYSGTFTYTRIDVFLCRLFKEYEYIYVKYYLVGNMHLFIHISQILSTDP